VVGVGFPRGDLLDGVGIDSPGEEAEDQLGLRFLHEFPRIDTPSGVYRTPYNQYDSIVRPLVKWLGDQGVAFEMSCRATGLDLKPVGGEITVERIRYTREGEPAVIPVTEDDRVFATLGSITADSRSAR
jgi:oleate hydratase